MRASLPLTRGALSHHRPLAPAHTPYASRFRSRLQSHARSLSTVLPQQVVSKTAPWTQEQLTSVHLYGLDTTSQMIGSALSRAELRGPITFLVGSNMKIEQWVTSEGKIQVVENGESQNSEGFDIEVVDGFPLYNMATDRRGSEHTRIRTLVVEEKQRFTSEVEPLDDSEYWEGHDEPRDSREKITFRSDLTNLVFGSDPEVQLVESRLALQDIGAPVAKVVENETALEAQGPIRHLIMRVDPQSLVEALLPLRPRLRRDSTIVLLPKGMGISEMLNEKVFPDPETRPNYVMADVRHSLMSVQNGSISTVSDVSSLAMLKLAAGGDPGTARFGFHHLHKGAFTISPVVQFSGESPSQYNARKRSAMFITGLLLGAPDLNARFLPAEDHRAARYLHTIVEAIVHPLTVFYNCTIQDIKLGDKRNRHLDRLIREVVPIVQPDLKRVTYDWLTRRVGDYITNRGDKVPVMLNRVGRGQRTSVDFLSGYIVRRAREMGLPVPREHLKMYKFIKNAEVKMAEYHFEQQEIRNLARREELRIQRQAEKEKGALEQGQEDLERKLRRVEQQELKDDYGAGERRAAARRAETPPLPKKDLSKPDISGLGNSALAFDTDFVVGKSKTGDKAVEPAAQGARQIGNLTRKSRKQKVRKSSTDRKADDKELNATYLMEKAEPSKSVSRSGVNDETEQSTPLADLAVRGTLRDDEQNTTTPSDLENSAPHFTSIPVWSAIPPRRPHGQNAKQSDTKHKNKAKVSIQDAYEAYEQLEQFLPDTDYIETQGMRSQGTPEMASYDPWLSTPSVSAIPKALEIDPEEAHRKDAKRQQDADDDLELSWIEQGERISASMDDRLLDGDLDDLDDFSALYNTQTETSSDAPGSGPTNRKAGSEKEALDGRLVGSKMLEKQREQEQARSQMSGNQALSEEFHDTDGDVALPERRRNVPIPPVL